MSLHVTWLEMVHYREIPDSRRGGLGGPHSDRGVNRPTCWAVHPQGTSRRPL
jgi:hypothetical protein